jgi:hypothetical protein
MKKRINFESKYYQQFTVQVPRKRPKNNTNAHLDGKERMWIKAKDYNDSKFATWEHKEDSYYVWFKRDSVPEEGEVVFGNFKIANMYRHRNNLRCIVQLIHI